MFRNMDRKVKRIGIISLVSVLVLGIGVGSFFIFKPKSPAAKTDVTVTFESTGGTEVASRMISTGEVLTDVAAPSRPGYVFAGWYYEEGPVNAYRSGDVFTSDTTLYAAWVEPETEGDLREHIPDCAPDMNFTVRSDIALTASNLEQYIRFFCVEDETCPALSVKPEGDGYLLYSDEAFTPGYSYVIERLDVKTVFFEKAGDRAVTDPGITAYTFTVFKENVNRVVKKAEPKLLSSDDATGMEIIGVVTNGQTGDARDDGKTIYRTYPVPSAAEYRKGDIVSFGNGQTDAPGNQYYRVIDAGTTGAGRFLDLIAPDIEEIYSELEIYYSGDAVSFEEIEDTEAIRALEEEMKISLLGSEGYDYMCRSIATGIKGSPSVLSALSKMSVADQKRFEKMSIDDLTELFQNVEVKISIQKTFDEVGQENGVRGVVSFSTGDITIPLDEKIKLTLNLTLTNDITETAYGYISLQENFKANIYKGATIKNHCNLDFQAVIGTGTGEQTLNITQEIQDLVNSASTDKTQEIVDSMNRDNFFGKDLDYVELFSRELGEKTVAIYEILSIQFKLTFHVDIGMRVGLNLNFDSTEVRKIGLNNLGGDGLKSVNERLYSRTHFTVILKGQIGIRAGFRAEINFSLVHLNDVINFGFSLDIGVYEEISGFVRFDYDTIDGFSMAGGIKSETGIYLGIEFTWNLFGWQDRLTIASFKFPILTIGSTEFASEFAETENAVTFNTDSYNLKSGDLLKLKYVDITGGAGGVKINIKPASQSGDYAMYLIKDQTGKGTWDDLKHVTVNKDTGIINISENAPDRLDFTAVVQYTRGSSLFSAGFEPITKTINMTYMKYPVENSSQKYTASFGWPDGRIIEQKEYYVGQVPVPPSEDLYEMETITGSLRLVSWAKPWKEDIAAIYANTTYHLDCEDNTRNIRFYGSQYDAVTKKSSTGLIAEIPSLYGDIPTAPALTDLSVEPGWVFWEWSPILKPVTSDYSYSAVYAQSPDFCRVNFYADGKFISGDFVKKGETPVAPDMSTLGDSASGRWAWWPSLGPVTADSQTYCAYFRKFANATFEDRDGIVISEQKILPGETPQAPAITRNYPGEEDYFEYRFSHFETREGSRIGPVYGDTVYKPVYVRNYFEVTTVFDAGERAFADGTLRKDFTGTYAPNNFLYLPQVSYKAAGKSYIVDYWQSTEEVNGSFIKLYMSDRYTVYKYNLTFRPVFTQGVPIEYTVRFFYDGKSLELTGEYGDLITQEMLSDIRKAPTDANHYYVVSSYGVTLPYRFGSSLDPDGQPYEDLGVAVRFEAVGVIKTITFDGNGGLFGGGEDVKTSAAPYGTTITFTDEPQKPADLYNTYTFVGWADEADAATGMDYDTFLVNGDRTLFAVYSGTPKEYTITFNAGEGHFAADSTAITQMYGYGEQIVPPADPTRDEDAVYRYVFLGWNPDLPYNTTVSGNATYTAEYRAIRIDGTFDETGIIVTDGTTYEDICVNGIAGYTYAFDDAKSMYTVTVTGNGLTFSGTGEDIQVVIASGVTDVTFDNLSISGSFVSMDGLLTTAEASTRLEIRISGDCSLIDTSGDGGARFERPVQLTGTGTGASLAFGGGLYCAGDFDVNDLEFEINNSFSAIGNDEGSVMQWWSFTNSVVRLNSTDAAIWGMNALSINNTVFTVTVTDASEYPCFECPQVQVSGSSVVAITMNGTPTSECVIGTGVLEFSDFTGSFSCSGPNIPAVFAGDIRFVEGGIEVSSDGYNLGGTVIGELDDGYGTFESFGNWVDEVFVPASSVNIHKN